MLLSCRSCRDLLRSPLTIPVEARWEHPKLGHPIRGVAVTKPSVDPASEPSSDVQRGALSYPDHMSSLLFVITCLRALTLMTGPMMFLGWAITGNATLLLWGGVGLLGYVGTTALFVWLSNRWIRGSNGTAHQDHGVHPSQ